MGLICRLLALLSPLLLAATPASAADPFVTVRPPTEGPANSAFWILEMESRPTGASVAGLPLAQINRAFPRGEPRACAVDALSAASFSSSDPAVRAEIRRYLSGPDGNIFRATTRMTGTPLLAVVGNYRTCSGDAAPFLLLVDQNRRRPRVAYLRTFPDWTPFIALRQDGNRLVISSCLECDHAEVLSYNRRTGRFAWRSAGL